MRALSAIFALALSLRSLLLLPAPPGLEIPGELPRVLRRGEAVREEVRGGVSVRVLANGLERILERLAPDVDIRSRRPRRRRDLLTLTDLV